MMDQDRNLGVTEARFALTIVICLLVAVGYVALLRLGGTGESTVEERVESATPPEIARIEPAPVSENDPEVLRIEPLQTPESRLSTRPQPPEIRKSHTPSALPGFPMQPAGSLDSRDPQRR
jgi:hypothetical protein